MRVIDESDLEVLSAGVEARLHNANRPVVVAVDGRSGTGKTTISNRLSLAFGGVVILADDFFSGGRPQYWAAKPLTERMNEVIDYDRVRHEVLEPLLAGRTATWHAFNWETFQGQSPEPLSAEPKPVIFLDGAYSYRPDMADIVDLSVLVRLPDAVRRRRLLDREGAEFMKAWHPIWDEVEDHYFTIVRPPESFDFVVDRASAKS